MASDAQSTEKLPGLDQPGGDLPEMPDFLQRRRDAQATFEAPMASRLTEAEERAAMQPPPEAEREPTVAEIEALIIQLSAKQASIERKKNGLKDALIDRIRKL